MANKKEINEKIAELLDFKKNGEHWTYPLTWEDENCSHPQDTIPDFVEMLRLCKEIRKHFQYGLPRQ